MEEEIKRLCISIALFCFIVGLFVGIIIASLRVESYHEKAAVAAGVAEWVPVADPSGGKPSFEFRYKTPPQQK